MAARGTRPTAIDGPPRPVLHLSGEKLRGALEALIACAERQGGIEAFAGAVRLKSEAFQHHLGGGKAGTLGLAEFEQLAAHMATVRRRIAPLIAANGWSNVRGAIADLLHDAHVPGTADARITRFEAALRAVEGMRPVTAGAAAELADGEERGRPVRMRFVRDLAAEILHNVYPEHYPLMTRWVWDAKTNTGVVREIWHDPLAGDDVDHIVIDVPDTHEAFLVLREELSQFLNDNGVFRDMLWYVDLVVAQVYASYINAQGGAYLRTEFASEGDPLEHTRRILGLDGIDRRTGRSRLKTIDGAARIVDDIKRLN